MAITQNRHTQYVESPGYHGQLTTAHPWSASSPIADGTDIAVGVCVAWSANGGAKMPESGDTMIGISLRSHAVENDATGQPVWRNNRAMSVLQQGVLYVEVAEAVTAGARCFVKPGSGEVTPVSSGNLSLPKARFASNTPANGIALLELH